MALVEKGVVQERDGSWAIDKIVHGTRIRQRGFQDKASALSVLRHRVALLTKQNIATEWHYYVESLWTDRSSWIYRTHQSAKWRGKKINKGCTLTSDELKTILLRSGGCCELTGIPFNRKLEGEPAGAFDMSLDRIDSDKGYVLANCRVVCLAVNLAMRDWGEEALLLIAKGLMMKHLQSDLEEVVGKQVTHWVTLQKKTG